MSASSPGTFELFPNLERALEIRLRLGVVALGEIDRADVVEDQRLTAGLPASRRICSASLSSGRASSGRPSVSLSREARLIKRAADARLVADLPLEFQRLVVALLGLSRLAEAAPESARSPPGCPRCRASLRFRLDLERLLVVAERLFGPVEQLVGDADRLQDVAARFFVVELDREGRALVQMVERILRITAPDFDATQRQQPFDELRVELDDLREVLRAPGRGRPAARRARRDRTARPALFGEALTRFSYASIAFSVSLTIR